MKYSCCFLQQTHQPSPGANVNDSVMDEAIRLNRARMRKTNHINNSSEDVSWSIFFSHLFNSLSLSLFLALFAVRDHNVNMGWFNRIQHYFIWKTIAFPRYNIYTIQNSKYVDVCISPMYSRHFLCLGWTSNTTFILFSQCILVTRVKLLKKEIQGHMTYP